MAENNSGLASNVAGGVRILSQNYNNRNTGGSKPILPSSSSSNQSSSGTQINNPLGQIGQNQKSDPLDITSENRPEVPNASGTKVNSIRNDYEELRRKAEEEESQEQEAGQQRQVDNLQESNEDFSTNYENFNEYTPATGASDGFNSGIILLVAAAIGSIVIYIVTTGVL